jgi:hypothetical protein
MQYLACQMRLGANNRLEVYRAFYIFPRTFPTSIAFPDNLGTTTSQRLMAEQGGGFRRQGRCLRSRLLWLRRGPSSRKRKGKRSQECLRSANVARLYMECERREVGRLRKSTRHEQVDQGIHHDRQLEFTHTDSESHVSHQDNELQTIYWQHHRCVSGYAVTKEAMSGLTNTTRSSKKSAINR